MKIALVSQYYAPFVGGVETHIKQLAHALKQRGHEVTVIAGSFKAKTVSPRLAPVASSLLVDSYADYDDGGVAVRSLTPRGTLDRVRMAPTLVRSTPMLQGRYYHVLQKAGYPAYRNVHLPRLLGMTNGADLIHAFNFDYVGWAARDAAQKHGIPLVVTPFVHPHQWGDSPNDVTLYHHADAVIGLVETDTAYLNSLGVASERLHTIGVSPDVTPSADAQAFRVKYDLGNKPVILYVGRMMAQKGAAAVVASAPLVWKKQPDTQFVFIGPSSEQERKLFEQTDPRIRYLGKVSAQEKNDALAACDIFCMPSLSEILPTVYLEAWTYGRPVVGGLAHGLPELIERSKGGIASSQAPTELSATLIRLLNDTMLRQEMGQQGQSHVEAFYSVRAVTDAFESLYRSLISRGSANGKR